MVTVARSCELPQLVEEENDYVQQQKMKQN
jgi:hypothetical protein